MNEQEFNSFFDGELKDSDLDAETLNEVKLYSEAVRILKARFEYTPSHVSEVRVLAKLSKKRRIFRQVVITASAVAIALFTVIALWPEKPSTPPQSERAAVTDVFDYLNTVRLVGDGF